MRFVSIKTLLVSCAAIYLAFIVCLPAVEAACGATTVFDQSRKKTLFEPLGYMTYANITGPTLPATTPPLDWEVGDECPPVSVTGTKLTFLPNTRPATTVISAGAALQGYNLGAWYPRQNTSYSESWDFVNPGMYENSDLCPDPLINPPCYAYKNCFFVPPGGVPNTASYPCPTSEELFDGSGWPVYPYWNFSCLGFACNTGAGYYARGGIFFPAWPIDIFMGNPWRISTTNNPSLIQRNKGSVIRVSVPALSSIVFDSDPVKQREARQAIGKNIALWGAADIKVDTSLGSHTFSVPAKLPKIIVVSGIGTSSNNKIFSWFNDIFPGVIKIAPGAKSISRSVKLLKDAIDQQLFLRNKVIVYGHSLGAIVAYQLYSEGYSNKAVKFVFIDPPFRFGKICNIRAYKILGFGTKLYTLCDALEQMAMVNWTDGRGLSNFLAHDPFDFPWFGKNKERLRQLRDRVIDDVWTDIPSGDFTPATFPDAPQRDVPSIESVPTTIYPDSEVLVTGSHFNLGGANNILLENIADPRISYQVDGIDSSATQLRFTVPSSMDSTVGSVPGAYTLKMSSLNGEWSAPVNVTIASNGPADPFTVIEVFPSDPTTNSFIIAGSGFSPIGNSVRLTAANSTIYRINAITSTGKIIYFTVPAAVPPGTYSVSIATADKIWLNLNLTITVAKVLILNSIRLNSSYHVGDSVPIEYASSGISGVTISLYDYKGMKLIRNITASAPASGTYMWTVPPDIDFSFDTLYKIRVSDKDFPSVYQQSSKVELLPREILREAPRIIDNL